LGSLERFIAILLEHTGGKLPLWLAPGQVLGVPVSEKAGGDARGGVESCRDAGLRAEADPRHAKLNFKIPGAQLEKVPVLAVVGEREAADGTVAPRIGGENRGAEALDAFVARTRAEAHMPGGAS